MEMGLGWVKKCWETWGNWGSTVGNRSPKYPKCCRKCSPPQPVPQSPTWLRICKALIVFFVHFPLMFWLALQGNGRAKPLQWELWVPARFPYGIFWIQALLESCWWRRGAAPKCHSQHRRWQPGHTLLSHLHPSPIPTHSSQTPHSFRAVQCDPRSHPQSSNPSSPNPTSTLTLWAYIRDPNPDLSASGQDEKAPDLLSRGEKQQQ